MAFSKQSSDAASAHQSLAKDGMTCIDCHRVSRTRCSRQLKCRSVSELDVPSIGAYLLDANPNQLLAVRIDDMDGASETGIEAVIVRRISSGCFGSSTLCPLSAASYGPSVPAASRGPAFHVVGTTAW